MSALCLLTELINTIECSAGTKRTGHAQSAHALTFKWKEIDKTADRNVLKSLQKFRVINPEDIRDREAQPNISSIITKYQSLIKQHANTKFKLIILVRHGEGVHNWAKWELFGPKEWIENQSTDLKWKDPPLTQKGVDQVKTILPAMECLQSHIELAVLSPLNRAIETATHAFLPLLEVSSPNTTKSDDVVVHRYQCPVIVLEYIRERVNHHSCDSRDSLCDKKEKWKEYDFEWEGFETNEDNQWDKTHDEKREVLWERSARMMDFIWKHPANVVVYSGHCDFIMSLMEVILDMPFYKPRNAQYFPIIVAEK